MSEEFEIETEVRDLKDKSVVGAKVPRMVRTTLPLSGCSSNQPTPPHAPPREPLPQEVQDAPCCWAPEMDWMLSLMQDKELLNLRDVITYRQDAEEYFRNPKCHISCATMEYIKSRIDEELKYRRTR